MLLSAVGHFSRSAAFPRGSLPSHVMTRSGNIYCSKSGGMGRYTSTHSILMTRSSSFRIIAPTSAGLGSWNRILSVRLGNQLVYYAITPVEHGSAFLDLTVTLMDHSVGVHYQSPHSVHNSKYHCEHSQKCQVFSGIGYQALNRKQVFRRSLSFFPRTELTCGARSTSPADRSELNTNASRSFQIRRPLGTFSVTIRIK